MSGFDFWNRLSWAKCLVEMAMGSWVKAAIQPPSFRRVGTDSPTFFFFSFFNSNFLAGFKGRERRNETTYVSEAWTVKAAGV